MTTITNTEIQASIDRAMLAVEKALAAYADKAVEEALELGIIEDGADAAAWVRHYLQADLLAYYLHQLRQIETPLAGAYAAFKSVTRYGMSLTLTEWLQNGAPAEVASIEV